MTSLPLRTHVVRATSLSNHCHLVSESSFIVHHIHVMFVDSNLLVLLLIAHSCASDEVTACYLLSNIHGVGLLNFSSKLVYKIISCRSNYRLTVSEVRSRSQLFVRESVKHQRYFDGDEEEEEKNEERGGG